MNSVLYSLFLCLYTILNNIDFTVYVRRNIILLIRRVKRSRLPRYDINNNKIFKKSFSHWYGGNGKTRLCNVSGQG